MNIVKKSVFLVLVLSSLVASASASKGEYKKVFNEGIANAIKVITYEKDMSLNSKKMGGMYCLKIREISKKHFSSLDAIRLEALSLIMEYKPAHLIHEDETGAESVFCFATAETKEGIDASLKGIKFQYPKIGEYDPKIIKLETRGKWSRVIPSLGKWSKDMSGTIETLNEKIDELSGKLKDKNREAQSYKKKLDRYIENIERTVRDVKDKLYSDNENTSKRVKVTIEENPYTSQKNEKKAKDTPKKEKSKKKKLSKKEHKNNVKESSHSDRVLYLDKK